MKSTFPAVLRGSSTGVDHAPLAEARKGVRPNVLAGLEQGLNDVDAQNLEEATARWPSFPGEKRNLIRFILANFPLPCHHVNVLGFGGQDGVESLQQEPSKNLERMTSDQKRVFIKRHGPFCQSKK